MHVNRNFSERARRYTFGLSMATSRSGRTSTRVSNGLVALGSAAVLAIYSAGYARTGPAGARLAMAAERRPPRAAPGPQADTAAASPAVVLATPPAETPP